MDRGDALVKDFIGLLAFTLATYIGFYLGFLSL